MRRNHHTGEMSLDPVRWGLIPYFCDDLKGGESRSMRNARLWAYCRPSVMPIAGAAASFRSMASSNGRQLRAR